MTLDEVSLLQCSGLVLFPLRDRPGLLQDEEL